MFDTIGRSSLEEELLLVLGGAVDVDHEVSKSGSAQHHVLLADFDVRALVVSAWDLTRDKVYRHQNIFSYCRNRVVNLPG